jgi:hypothetical protein
MSALGRYLDTSPPPPCFHHRREIRPRILEEPFTCVLINPVHMAQVPGRKTDVQDCVWIAPLLEHGFLRGSFGPPLPIRELRHLTPPTAWSTRDKWRSRLPELGF